MLFFMQKKKSIFVLFPQFCNLKAKGSRKIHLKSIEMIFFPQCGHWLQKKVDLQVLKQTETWQLEDFFSALGAVACIVYLLQYMKKVRRRKLKY